MMRRFAAELLGTGLLVFFGVGVATLNFGFKFDGGSIAAGVVATALAFGLVLLALAYVLGPISGCHVNPAVTLGAWLARRISLVEAAGYWVAQFIGGILGALLLWAMFSTSPDCTAGRPRDWARTAGVPRPTSTSGSAARSWPRWC